MGSGVEKRAHMAAIRAAKLAADGWTHRQIAEALGYKPEQVKSRIVLGQRLMQAEEQPK